MLNPPGRALTPVLRLIVPAAAVALACVASTAMIGLGFHYFTDTIAGAAVGIGTVTATALVLDLPGPRRWLAAVGGRDEPLLSRFNARVRAHGGLGQVADRDQVLASGDTTPFGVVRADSPVS
jgi:membrane-associated phospholipid phosphatase